MPKTSDPNAHARLTALLRGNLSRRKSQLRERAAEPEKSELAARANPVHDPDVTGTPKTG
jgi:hypothetical protein